jgi:hypothetical protein
MNNEKPRTPNVPRLVFSLPVCADRVGAAGVLATTPLLTDGAWAKAGVVSAIAVDMVQVCSQKSSENMR